MIRMFALTCAATLVAVSSAFAASPPPSVEVKLDPQHGSKIGGTATIVHQPKAIRISITLDGVFIPENRYPAGVYIGTCAKLSAKPEFPLTPVMGGRSVTQVDPRAHEHHRPMAPSYAIAVFDTAGKQSMSCGELPPMKHAQK